MKFVKLTQSSDGKPTWINLDRVDFMTVVSAAEVRYTLLISSGKEIAAVEESPEEILARKD